MCMCCPCLQDSPGWGYKRCRYYDDYDDEYRGKGEHTICDVSVLMVGLVECGSCAVLWIVMTATTHRSCEE